jgi:type II secretory pathway pseudopilin PulG
MTKSIAIIIILILVLVAILAFFNAQDSAYDEKVTADIIQVREALKIFYDENAYYPTSINAMPLGIEKYLEFWPNAPKPKGICKNNDQAYSYESIGGGTDYKLTYCLSDGIQVVNSK